MIQKTIGKLVILMLIYIKMKDIEYWRNPTAAEIKFGEGAIHYRNFPECFCTKDNGDYKKWLMFEGLRYNH